MLPSGIDYAKWTKLVDPAPRDAFRDSLDLLELLTEGADRVTPLAHLLSQLPESSDPE